MNLFKYIFFFCVLINFSKAQNFPPIIGHSIEGEIISLKADSKYTFIYAWATWCKPCIDHMDTLNTLVKKYPQVRFLQIVYDSTEEYMRFLHRTGKQFNFECIVNGQHLLENLASLKFPNVESGLALPMMFILNDQSKLIWVKKRFTVKTIKKINDVLSKIK